MEKERILNDMIEIMRKLTHNNELSFGMNATDKDIDGWSSLVHTELIVEIEKKYGFKFSLMEVLSMKKDMDILVNLIAQHV